MEGRGTAGDRWRMEGEVVVLSLIAVCCPV